ncbi:MAG: response regulator [Desulfuromusa sp.]|jgi:two-component system response regulator (stage 0 sporulation protein F)|nr:response regulator [Desulfuromusa sp.]
MERILIVEDEENTRIGLVKLLCQDGYQAEAVANGFEALDYLGNNKVDLIITDVNMPEMNGLVFLRKLNQSYPEIKVILMTAYGGVGSYLEAINLGALDYLNKPVNLSELKAIIGRMFNQTSPLGGSATVF